MLMSILGDYKYAYLPAKGTIPVPNMVLELAAENKINKKVKFKSCVSFTDCMRKIKTT